MSPADHRRRIDVRRVYEADLATSTSHRVLVDRLWPRGVSKAAAPVDEWLKDVAPSTELRRWYGHDVSRFDEFARRYRAELTQPPASDIVARLARIAEREHVTLVTATRDVEHSGATVLSRHLGDIGNPIDGKPEQERGRG